MTELFKTRNHARDLEDALAIASAWVDGALVVEIELVEAVRLLIKEVQKDGR